MTREFPNRVRLQRECKDFYGKTIPNKVVLIHGPSSVFGVKVRGEDIYGLYGNDKGNEWWVNLKDADLYALRQYGYSLVK